MPGRPQLAESLQRRFPIRLAPVIHANLLVWAYISGKSKSEMVSWAISEYLRQSYPSFERELQEYASLSGQTPDEVRQTVLSSINNGEK